MPATQTLAQMRTRAKRHADMSDPADAGKMTDADWTEFINQGCVKVYNALVIARGHEFYVTRDDFQLVVGQTDYTLPSDHYLTLSVHVSTDGSTGWRRVEGWQESQLEHLWSNATGSIGSLYARVQAGNLVFLPAPGAALYVRHRYVPTFTRLSSDSDTFDGVNGWEEAVCLHAAIAALKREQSMEEAQALLGELAEWEKRIEDLAAHRHLTEADRIPTSRHASFDHFIGSPRDIRLWEPGVY